MKDVTGIHIYYYIVCKRKLWYFLKECRMEYENPLVQMGKFIDEQSYSREEKHINIMNIVNIDFIKDNILCETKKSKKIEEASIWQMKYYLYVLSNFGVDGFIGEIDYPNLKQKVKVTLSLKDIEKIKLYCEDIKKINQMSLPPTLDKKSYCKSCAYYDLCFI